MDARLKITNLAGRFLASVEKPKQLADEKQAFLERHSKACDRARIILESNRKDFLRAVAAHFGAKIRPGFQFVVRYEGMPILFEVTWPSDSPILRRVLEVDPNTVRISFAPIDVFPTTSTPTTGGTDGPKSNQAD